ncbi:xanthine dehydrogenase molybdopterin binding subunit [Entomobacter blattae]|uniref:Xanthine dehydrogenase molybdenum-binding subunit XdhA n=1 Tax=Entomobacter blattae TaxID=2762277 RepID=A0A7H1NU72_9PROT|nr:xanthine dehydrogenase molybdopterin binding subunit [Entomobacter blattae]QNT79332.1 Putative xanthine dehydrogenase molybdenum-binding subunit XdhA [Entomobacter blattae]
MDQSVASFTASNSQSDHAQPHESAALHVKGEASYIDDLAEIVGTLHMAIGLSKCAHGYIRSMDLSQVKEAEGVVCVLTAQDIPAANEISATGQDHEPLLAESKVMYHGQAIFAVVAHTHNQARRAVQYAQIDYEPLDSVITIEDAQKQALLTKADYVCRTMRMQKGDSAKAIAHSPRRLTGKIAIGGQEHFYLEGQIAYAHISEDERVKVFSSTQHPTETQHAIAHILGIYSHNIVVEVRRMGGAFGGKESQAVITACLATLGAMKTGYAVKLRLDRDDDMKMTGKRHDFHVNYQAGFDETGKIHGVDMDFSARCGWSADLSAAVVDRALFHADNAYHYPHVSLRSHPFRTNTPSNTAFRGFGAPQGIVAAERMIEAIAYATGLDPLDVRKRNFYDTSQKQLTPYHMTVEDSIIAMLVEQLEISCQYRERRQKIHAENTHGFMRRGIALTPVKFGISFTATHLNQAGALAHLYTDGSVLINHGGTEMGQGLHTKMLQVAARVLGIESDQVKISATVTDKVPNTSATAASSGADMNGMAVMDAVSKIKKRLTDFIASQWKVSAETISFSEGVVSCEHHHILFKELVKQAYMARISLSSSGFYKTPKISWDITTGRGRPFYYFAYGAACAEVEVNILTGQSKVKQVDILHDAGLSLNPALDIGQIEGGFIQGMGWLTTEELVYAPSGQLLTHAPSTYKIPAFGDCPEIMNVTLLENSPNQEHTIFHSKAVGEPPLVHGVAVFQAISDAIASLDHYKTLPDLNAPATAEEILKAVYHLKALQTERR